MIEVAMLCFVKYNFVAVVDVPSEYINKGVTE
jgi:uncharacterized protein (DUF3820 family)